MSIEAGKLIYKVQADTAEMRKQLDSLEKRIKTSSKSTGSLASTIGSISPVSLTAAGAIALLSAGLYKSVKASSDLQEQTAKFNTVFGPQQALAESWANTLVESYAMSTREAKQNLAAMQDLLEPMGMNAEAAAKMSFEVVKLAADLGSFNNLPTADVMGDIQSALVGNFETMKKYGVVLNETVTKEEGRRMGLVKGKEALTASQKAEVAMQLILKGSKNAIGDMERTGDSYANSTKKMSAAIENLAASLGDNLIPMATQAVQVLTKAAVALTAFSERFSQARAKIEGSKNALESINKTIGDMEALYKKLQLNVTVSGTEEGRNRLADLTGKLQQLYAIRKRIQTDIEAKPANTENITKQTAATKQASDEEVKAWQAAKNKLLQINSDYEKKLATQRGDSLAVINQEEFEAYQQVKEVAKTSETEAQKARLQIAQYYANERKNLEQRAMLESVQSAVQFASSSVSQLGSIFSQYAANQSAALDNEQTKRQAALTEWYDEQKAEIDGSVLTEKQRTKKLEALDQERARRETALQEDIDKKKRKIEYEAAKRAKVINITQSIMNTALGITNALARSGPPWVGIAMAAVIGALGAAQTAMIASQPLPELAEGGVVQATRGGVPVITGEGGANELVAPLTPEVYENLAENIVAAQTASSASASTLHVIFENGGVAVGDYVMKGTKNGTIRIDMRSLVKN